MTTETLESVTTKIDRLGDTAMAIKHQRDAYRAALSDIAMGCEILLQPPFEPRGSFHAFVTEVRKVARAALDSDPS